ncbi:hypothetical protein ASE01_15685 [Nocardioides sp. Root190]|nr:hypothetical protein ASE01_15685 [Nocardioides sp. Root190]
MATGLLLAAAAPVVLGADPAHAVPPDDEGYDAPLEVTISSLTPGVLSRTGPLVIEGTVTNVDLETWRDIDLFPMASSGPDCALTPCAPVMTTAAELQLAADSDPETPIGARYLEISDDITSLEPGQSASYTLRIPQDELRRLFPTPTSGVYWFGVHALGSSDKQAYDSVADGRARTFLPYAADRLDAPVDTAIVVPLRGRIAHTADGALDRTEGWERSLAFDGDLGGPLAFGAASGTAPVTWLVDPAVPDAVHQLSLGNPDREVVPTPDPDEASPSSEPSEDTEGEESEDATDTPLARAARTWLERAREELESGAVATLPYGDPDIAAAADSQPTLYRSARELGGTVLGAWEIDGNAVVAPPDGYLDRAGIDSVDDDAPLLLGDRMFPAETFSVRPPVAGLIGERPVVVTAEAAADGGPGPDPAQAPVALRQRILSEAVVRLLRAGRQAPEPLVVVLPATVTADDAPEFWEGLDSDLVRTVALDQLVVSAESTTETRTGDERQIDPAELSYPATQEKNELSATVLAEAGRLVRAARTYQAILGEDFAIGTDLVGEALAGTSYAVRSDRSVAGRLARTREWVQDQLDQVVIDAPPGVTLSGTSGGFNVAVRNDLDHPVTVQVRASTEDGAEIEVANPVRLAANSRTSVPISATMTRAGVHNVTLRLTDVDGHALGGSDTLPLRTGQAGIVIWAIIGAGGGILFVAIGIRLVRRYRRRHAAEDDAGNDAGDDAEQEPTPEPVA